MRSSPSKAAPILALDWGDRRIGVSISPDGQHALIRQTIHCTGMSDALAQLQEYIRAEQVRTLVVGLPLTLRSEKGTMAKHIEAQARQLADLAGVSLVFIDERETTNYARRLRSKYPEYEVDSVAALILLEEFLAQKPTEASY